MPRERAAATTGDPVRDERVFGPPVPGVDLVGSIMGEVRALPALERREGLPWSRWAPHAVGVLAAWALWTSPVLRPSAAALVGLAADLGARGLVAASVLVGTAAGAGIALWPALVGGTAGVVAVEAVVLSRWLHKPAR